MTAAIVWLASYPKSGNTWLRILLSNLLAQAEQPININQISLAGLFPVSIQQMSEATLIDAALLRPNEADLLRPSVIAALLTGVGREAGDQFVKVHDAYRFLPDGTPLLGRDVARAALYILRDPRDVVVSASRLYGLSVDRAIDVINKDRYLRYRVDRAGTQVPQRLLDWSGHVRSWTRQSDVPVHVLRYEDLLADTVAAFGKAVEFLGLSSSPDALATAVRHADFKELSRQEGELGFRENVDRAAGSRFFRAGRAGGWVDVLTPAQAAAIEAAHGEVMAAYGYL